MVWAAAAIVVIPLIIVLTHRAWIGALVRWRLGPYRVVVNRVDAALPEKLTSPQKVAVVGGGLAGIAAADLLGARGYQVTLFESHAYLGGKLGSWPVELVPGRTEWVSHGFHAFFRHYYNLNRFLDSLGLRKSFKPISDYRVLLPGGAEVSFGKLENTPIVNLIALWRNGVYRMSEAVRAPTRDGLSFFLEYDQAATYAQLDQLSFAEFSRRSKIPQQLQLVFNTFSRAFFSETDKVSMAELVKGFHSYYLSHDGGLLYDHPSKDFEASLLRPIRERLSQRGVDLRLSTPVKAVDQVEGGFEIAGERFSKVVLAAHSSAVRTVVESSKLPGADPRLKQLVSGQRYAVLRLWLDKRTGEKLPVFVATERYRILDSITFYDRNEDESAQWVRDFGGSVVELHCYAVPDALSKEDVRTQLVEDLESFLPELKGARVKHEHFQLNADFSAYHVGMRAGRPGIDSGVRGLYCAGDWVALDFPAMLMEGAFSSGLVAANRVLALDGLREEPIESIPLKGVLAGVPQTAARRALVARKAD